MTQNLDALRLYELVKCRSEEADRRHLDCIADLAAAKARLEIYATLDQDCGVGGFGSRRENEARREFERLESRRLELDADRVNWKRTLDFACKFFIGEEEKVKP